MDTKTPSEPNDEDTREKKQRQRDEKMRERQRRRKLETEKIKHVTKDHDYATSDDDGSAEGAKDTSLSSSETMDADETPAVQQQEPGGTGTPPQGTTQGATTDVQQHQPEDDDATPYKTVSRKKSLSQQAARARVEEKRKRLALELSNQFDSLSEREEEEPAPKRRPVQRKEEAKVPPLFIKTSNYIKLNYTLKSIIQGSLRAVFRGDHIKYQFDTLSDYHLAFRFCQDNNLPFFTHQQNDKREKKMVIKGLPPQAETEDIKQDLESQGFRVSMVHQYKKRDPDSKTLRPSATYTALLPKDQQWEKIYQVQYILLTKVTIEDYEPRVGPPQCKRCLRWDHTANYCWMPARCLKCGGNHEKKDCTLKDSEPAKCAGCKGNHPASWRGCSEYQKALRSWKPSPANKAKKESDRQSSTTAAPKLVFASQAGPSGEQRRPPTNPWKRTEAVTTPQGSSSTSAIPGWGTQASSSDTKFNFWDVATKFLSSLFSPDTVTKIILFCRRFYEAQGTMAKLMVLVEAATHFLF